MNERKRARKQEVIDRNEINLEWLERRHSVGLVSKASYAQLSFNKKRAINEAKIGM